LLQISFLLFLDVVIVIQVLFFEMCFYISFLFCE